MQNFTHLLLTRFNVRTRGTKKIQPNQEWLEKRFKLFDEICYPSIYAQSNQDFTWLIFFDINTPDYFLNKIEAYSGWKNLIPIYIDCEFSDRKFPNSLRTVISSSVKNGSKYLITTRLDNDDAVSKDYIEAVQKNFKGQQLEGITFPLGYQMFEEKLYLYLSTGNHFISLIEKYDTNTFKTVFCSQHSKLYRVAPIKKVIRQPSWLEVVHGGNIANRYDLGLRIPGQQGLKNFCINSEKFLKQEEKLIVWEEQIKFLLSFPRYLIHKIRARIKYHEFRDIFK
jgi:hypothetical protein